MTQQSFPADLIHSNPWQPRAAFDAASVAELADDIKTRGLLQVPIARQNGNGVELAFGHRRLAAWRIAFPDQPFPVEVRELTDRDMSDMAASENAQRRDLTAIETARAIQRRIVDFKLTQLEAAKPFGLTSQGGVSNLLRLLKLPVPIQDLVQQHKLAERNARALLVLERVAPDQTLKIAEASMSADNAEEFVDDAIDRLVWNKGRNLGAEAAFKLNWPKEPIPLAKPIGDLTELPACTDCVWRVHDNVRRAEGVCVRPVCFDAKQKAALALRVPQLARSLGIPLAGADEKVTLLWDGGNLGDIDSWYARPKVQRLVKARLPELRIVPALEEGKNGYHYREDILGSRWIALATTNKAAVMKWVNADKEKQQEKVAEVRQEERAEESESAKRKRIEKEKREQAERRAERSAFLKSKYDTLWLLLHVTEVIEPQIEIDGGILRLAEHHLVRDFDIYSRWVPMNEQSGKLANAARAEKDKDRKAALMVQRIVYHVLAKKVSGDNFGGDKDEKVYDFQRAVGMARTVVTQTFEATLPAGWDKPPVHQTQINCWQCGKFAPNESGLTGRDEAEGWINNLKNGAAEEYVGVFCSEEDASEHAAAYLKSQARPAKKAMK